MAVTERDVHPKGKTPQGKDSESGAQNGKASEGSARKGKASESTALESSARKDKTSEAAALESNALKCPTKPSGRAAPERCYTMACAVLGALTAAGFTACLILRNEWGTALFFPLLGAAATALLWCALARLCFCRDPERLLARDFTRTVRRALEIPVCTGITALLCLLPAEIPFSVSVLLVLLFLAAVPAAALTGVLSVCSAVRHLRAASISEPSTYREGPLVLAALLLVAELAALGWLAVYLLI